jgi:ABC-type maltose transport system permease subunit
VQRRRLDQFKQRLRIATAPIVMVYLIAQRQFISGLTAGALKG